MNSYIRCDPYNELYKSKDELKEMTDIERHTLMDTIILMMNNHVQTIDDYHLNNTEYLTFEYLISYAKFLSLSKIYDIINEHCIEKKEIKYSVSASKNYLDITTLEMYFPFIDMTDYTRFDSIVIKHYCYMLLSYIRVYANRKISRINGMIDQLTIHDYNDICHFLNVLNEYRSKFINQLILYSKKYDTNTTLEKDTPGIDLIKLLPFPTNTQIQKK